MPDYTQGKIYKIVKKDDHTQCYVGSTTQTLNNRLVKHKDDSRTRKSLFYLTVNGKWDEWDMILIEDYPYSSKKKLVEKETEYRLKIGILNTRVEGRTKKQYCQDNKEDLAKKNKEWREKNKDEIKQKNKEYREKNRDEINRKQREARALKKAQQNGV